MGEISEYDDYSLLLYLLIVELVDVSLSLNILKLIYEKNLKKEKQGYYWLLFQIFSCLKSQGYKPAEEWLVKNKRE